MLKSPGKLLLLFGLLIAGLAQYFSVQKLDQQENSALISIKSEVENKINKVNNMELLQGRNLISG
jgi:hypothetical protein